LTVGRAGRAGGVGTRLPAVSSRSIVHLPQRRVRPAARGGVQWRPARV